MAPIRNKRIESGMVASVHETASGPHKLGVIDEATMREFDALCPYAGGVADPTERLPAWVALFDLGDASRSIHAGLAASNLEDCSVRLGALALLDDALRRSDPPLAWCRGDTQLRSWERDQEGGHAAPT
jgi:hypothetical protein